MFFHLLSGFSWYEFQLEKLWTDILTCIQSRHCGPYNSDLLTIMAPLLVRHNMLHSGFSHIYLTSSKPLSLPSDVHIIFIIQQFCTICFLQEVTLCHPKRSIKNHAVMFWNATFAHSQSLKYPENLRYIQLFFFCNWPFWTYFSSYILFTTKCTCILLLQTSSSGRQRQNVTYSARLGKHRGMIAHTICFKSTLKVLVVNWLGSDR